MGRPKTANLTSSATSNPRTRLCPVCNHPERAEIERLVLSVSPDNPALSIDAIADAFNLSSADLRVHALMHTPLALDFSDEADNELVNCFKDKIDATSEGTPSNPAKLAKLANPAKPHENETSKRSSGRERLADKVNMREGDMLLASANELLTTMTTLGRRIKRYASDGSEGSDQRLTAFCNNAVVNLYIGAGSELRKTIGEINELNTALNGGPNAGADGLKALAAAIAGSAPSSGSATQSATATLEATEDDD